MTWIFMSSQNDPKTLLLYIYRNSDKFCRMYEGNTFLSTAEFREELWHRKISPPKHTFLHKQTTQGKQIMFAISCLHVD